MTSPLDKRWWSRLRLRGARPAGRTGPARRARPAARSPRLEALEDRTLLAGHTLMTATPIPLPAGGTATVSGYLASGRDADLYAVTLSAGDTVRAVVAAQGLGSTLDGVLRVFDAAGHPVAADDNLGGLDPALAVQAPAPGTYYVGVSSVGNDHYDPAVAPGDQGSSLGIYQLRLSVTSGPLLPDVVGASFQVVGSPARWGDTVTVHYTLENRGGEATAVTAPAGFAAGITLASDNRLAGHALPLGTIPVTNLAPGASVSGSLTVTLPGAPGVPPPGYTEPEPVFVGLVPPTDALRGGVPSPNVGRRQGEDEAPLHVLVARTAAEPNDSIADVQSGPGLPVDSLTTGTLTAADGADYFKISLPANTDGRLVVRVPNSTFADQLYLLDAGGTPLASSQGGLPGQGDPVIDRHLSFGSDPTNPVVYYLAVQDLSGSGGAYALATEFQPSSLPDDVFVQDAGGNPVALVAADFDSDGLPDLAQLDGGSNDVTVLLGAGGGTFQAAQSYAVGNRPSALVVGDFNGDGVPDLAVANAGDNNVSILLGNGDGTFHEMTDGAGMPLRPVAGADPVALAVGDFNGDGKLDLAVADRGTNTVTILLGNGDGTFRPLPALPVAAPPGARLSALTAADLNADGKPDLAVALDGSAGQVAVFLGNGAGTFRAAQDALGNPVRLTVGADPKALAAVDFNGDDVPDLVTADSGSGTVSVLLGQGGGRFAPAVPVAVGDGPQALAAGDFNNDGHVDLAVADGGSNDVSVLLGQGDGGFTVAPRLAYGLSPVAVAAADLDGDGSVDLVTASSASALSVLRGRGDGTFLAGAAPAALASADFNRDANPDLASADGSTGGVTIYLGAGDGTFPSQVHYAVGTDPTGIAAADFNGDGRPDLAVADRGSNDVTILLGLGDGTFRPAQVIPGVGDGPAAIAAGDFTAGGLLDLVVVDSRSDQVVLLPGNGDGSFAAPVVLADLPAGSAPVAVALGDYNGDGNLDLAVADEGTDKVAFLLGIGDGTFGAPVYVPVGMAPDALAVGKFADGKDDLAVANSQGDGGKTNDGSVSIVHDQGGVAFNPAVVNTLVVGADPAALVEGAFSGPGAVDLVTVNAAFGDVTFLRGTGNDQFGVISPTTLAATPLSVAAADFDRDGQLDLAVGENSLANIQMLRGQGDGEFNPLGGNAPPSIHSAPILADVNGDGAEDLVVLDRSGNILVRPSVMGAPGTFLPPLPPVNRGGPARDVTVLRYGPGRVALAAVSEAGNKVLLYGLDTANRVTALSSFDTGGLLPSRIVAADLQHAGDGYDDFEVLNSATRDLAIFLSDGNGGFSRIINIGVGAGPSDLALAHVSGDPKLDAIVTDPLSEAVNVVFSPEGPRTEEMFPAGLGPYAADSDDNVDLLFRQGTGAIVADDFNNDGRADVVVADPAGDRLAVLLGQADGFAPAVTIPLGYVPAALVVGPFDGTGNADLAVLDGATDTVHVYLGDGHGRFTEKHRLDADGRVVPLRAGPGATGLTVADATRPGGGAPDGIPDLLVGDGFGDVLTLVGNGDGTFSPLARSGGSVPLVTPDLDGNGTPDAVLADPAADRVTSAVRLPGSTRFVPGSFTQDRANGLLAPDALLLTDLNGDGTPDLVVADGGANSVLVYLGQPGGGFAGRPLVFPAGTNPVGLTAADLNGDGIPDLVVSDQGSNDVAVLLGQGQDAAWTLTPGPRLQLAPGSGPIATTSRDVNGDGIPDLVVADGQNGTLSLLPGIGRNDTGTGFFSDANPAVLNLPGNPVLRAANGGFLVTADGAVVNADTLATVLPADPASRVRFVEPFTLPGETVPALFATRSDGSVALLTSATGDSYGVSEVFTDASLTSPSTLDVVPAGGELDIYVTQDGDPLPLDFTLDLGIPVAVPGTAGAGRPEVAELGSLMPGTVPIVPSLVTGVPAGNLLAGIPVGSDLGVFPAEGVVTVGGLEALPSAEAGAAEGVVVASATTDGGGDDAGAGGAAVGDQAISPFVLGSPAASTPDSPPGPEDATGAGDRKGPGDPAMPGDDVPDPSVPPAPEDRLLPAPPDRPPPDGTTRPSRQPAEKHSHVPEGVVPITAPPTGTETRLLPREQASLTRPADPLTFWWARVRADSPAPARAAERAGRHAVRSSALAVSWPAYPDMAARDRAAEARAAALLAAALLAGPRPGGGGDEPAQARRSTLLPAQDPAADVLP